MAWCQIKVRDDNYPEVRHKFVSGILDLHKRCVRWYLPIPYNMPDVMQVSAYRRN